MSSKRGFKTFIAPEFGVIVFWLGAVPLLLAAGLALAKGSFLIALGFTGSAIALRLVLEGMTVLFQMHDVLLDIRTALQGTAPPASTRTADERVRRARELAANVSKRTLPGESRLDTL